MHRLKRSAYLYSGKRFDDSDEVLFQQVVVQLGQVSVDDGVVPQLCSVLCEGLEEANEGFGHCMISRYNLPDISVCATQHTAGRRSCS